MKKLDFFACCYKFIEIKSLTEKYDDGNGHKWVWRFWPQGSKI